MKYRYRIVQKGDKYVPQWRRWFWPFWFCFVHTVWNITKECSSLEEAEAFLHETWKEDTKDSVRQVWTIGADGFIKPDRS